MGLWRCVALWLVCGSLSSAAVLPQARQLVKKAKLNPLSISSHDEAEKEFGGKFWQITDIHWDQQYSVAGDPRKMCHEGYEVGQDTNGKYGNYLCDSPWMLVQSAIQAMTEIDDRPDFILWTGDNVPHTNDPEPDFAVIFRTVNNITTELRTTFPTSIPIFPVLGNHDAFPKDDYPVAGEEFYGQYLTQGGWDLVLPEAAQEDFKKGGYYEAILPSGVTVLVVNTNLYYAFNKLGINATDPCNQFAWMQEKLQNAQDRGSKVIIAAHAPPGYFERFAVIPFFNATYNDMYADILNQYGEVIMAQIYGHEHTDSFRVFADEDGNPKSAAFLAPSVTPWYPAVVPGGTAINPSLRLFLYNSSNLLDYTQYHLNLTDINARDATDAGTSKPQWKEFYQARRMYDLDVLDAVNMKSLYERLSTDDELFQKYYLLNSAGYNHGDCGAKCKQSQLCAIGNIKISDLQHCMHKSMNDTETTTKPVLHGVPSYILNGRFPVSGEAAGSSHMVVMAVALGMTLMIALAVALAVVLVIITLQRYNVLGMEKPLAVSDLGIGARQQGYKAF